MKNQLNPSISNQFKKSLFGLYHAFSNVVIEEATREAKLGVVPFLASPDMAEAKTRAINLFSLDIQADNARAIVKEAMALHSTLSAVAEWIGVEYTTSFDGVVENTEATDVGEWCSERNEEVMVLFRRNAERLRLAVEEVLKECNKGSFNTLVDNINQVLFLVRLLCVSINYTEICEFGTAIKCLSLTAILKRISEETQAQ